MVVWDSFHQQDGFTKVYGSSVGGDSSLQINLDEKRAFAVLCTIVTMHHGLCFFDETFLQN